MKGAENYYMELGQNSNKAEELLIQRLLELKGNIEECISDFKLPFETNTNTNKHIIDSDLESMKRNLKDVLKNIDHVLNTNQDQSEQTLSEGNNETDTIQQLFDEFDLIGREDNSFIEEGFNEVMVAVKEVWKEFELLLPTLYKKREKLDEFLAAEYSRKLININRWLFDIVSLDNHYLNKQRKMNSYKGDLELILELFLSLLAFEKTVLKLGIEDFKMIEIEKIYNKLKLTYKDLCLLDVWKL